MKNFFYNVCLIIFFSIIVSLLFGFSVKYFLEGGKKYIFLKDPILFIAEIPYTPLMMIKTRSLNPNRPPILTKHIDKKRFEKFIDNKRNALLVLPRYDNDLSRSVTEIIDLNNFEVIHTYKHDISEMYSQVQNTKEFLNASINLSINDSPIRFEYKHPLILDDGSLISDSGDSPEFRIDFCSNLKWINDEEIFHHSKNFDFEGNIWIPSHLNPKSKYVKKYELKDFSDDSVSKINIDGKILYNKSVIEILIENKIVPNNFAINSYLLGNKDPIHLNDIEPVFIETDYWKQGDLFLSLRNQSSIIHYRPNTNKIIKYITGPFSQQHDIDIISDKEIAIFNNNNFIVDNEYSEILIFNYKTGEFKKLFNNQLKKNNFKTITNGLFKILNDGSLMIEETVHGRIILFNNEGEKEWEFVNKDSKGEIRRVNWSRIIEDEIFIKNFKSLIEDKKCLN
jgi:hypothetical protein